MLRKGDFSKKSTGANPVFEQWINEWKEDAVARDLQSKHTYSKVKQISNKITNENKF